MAIDIVRPSDPHFNRIPKKIKDNDRYWPYFKDCIGAIDRTHISVVMSTSKQIPYIGRKGFPTQNVMVVWDFNMCLNFAWVGWEGSANDMHIFLEALRRENLHFPHPPSSKYYLVDVGYPNIKGDQKFMPYDDDDELLPEEGENEREIFGEEQGTNSSHEREMDEERDRIVVLLMHRE
ncbi:hypothetical protein Ddye_026928 [Dipteronia dyeriana]|uniref:DDE Tnp4 domain-containing protein n=1 Tax=Dipteronia dyeriana TaxID=168575 RepID=A0AAD9TNK7_9ROSI|nr:hypothetical protein Ddye_026928 [Dipteronia dyeriana]